MCNGITYYLQNIQLIIPGGRDCAARVCHVRPVGDSGGRGQEGHPQSTGGEQREDQRLSGTS